MRSQSVNQVRYGQRRRRLASRQEQPGAGRLRECAYNTWSGEVELRDTRGHLRSLDIAKLGPLDLDLAVPLSRSIPDFAANVLAFTIAIRPDDESIGTPCLILNVLGNVLVVLRS